MKTSTAIALLEKAGFTIYLGQLRITRDGEMYVLKASAFDQCVIEITSASGIDALKFVRETEDGEGAT